MDQQYATARLTQARRPIERFNIAEPQNPPIDEFYEEKKRRSTHLQAESREMVGRAAIDVLTGAAEEKNLKAPLVNSSRPHPYSFQMAR